MNFGLGNAVADGEAFCSADASAWMCTQGCGEARSTRLTCALGFLQRPFRAECVVREFRSACTTDENIVSRRVVVSSWLDYGGLVVLARRRYGSGRECQLNRKRRVGGVEGWWQILLASSSDRCATVPDAAKCSSGKGFGLAAVGALAIVLL